MTDNIKHLPVLVDEVISYLKPKNKKIYFDGTFGQGGYSKKILESESKVVAIDQDFSSEQYAKKLTIKYPKNFFLKLINFPILKIFWKNLK